MHYVLQVALNLFAVLPFLSQPLILLALHLLQLAFAPAASPQAWFVLHRPLAIRLKANQRSEST
jgi:hypothetical protein